MSETDCAEINTLKHLELVTSSVVQVVTGMSDPALPGHIAFVLSPLQPTFILNHVEYDMSCTIAEGDLGKRKIKFSAAYPAAVKTVDFLVALFRKMGWHIQPIVS